MSFEVAKELQIFKTICSNYDYDILTRENIGFEDYVRLGYIVDKLELHSLGAYFHLKHYEKFKGIMDRLDELDEEYAEDRADKHRVEQLEEWIDKFIANIKDEETRERIADKLK